MELPSWRWMAAGRVAGRKAIGPGGKPLLLPVRVAWEPGPVVVVPSSTPMKAAWLAMGLNHTMSGQATINASLTAGPKDDDTGPVPDRFVGQSVSRGRLIGQLARWVEDGAAARWEALFDLENYVRRACQNAARVIADDYQMFLAPDEYASPGAARWRVVGDVAIECVVTRMLVGDEGNAGPVARLLDRCLQPDQFLRVDPVRYITRTVRRDAEDRLRTELGDPRVGSQLRRARGAISAGLGPDELVTEYRRRFPAHRLALPRIANALNPVIDPLANYIPLHDIVDRHSLA